jgi:hypothetical protein
MVRMLSIYYVMLQYFADSPFIDAYSPVCDSYVRPETLVRICDECNFGTYGGRCIICGSPGAYPPHLREEIDRLLRTQAFLMRTTAQSARVSRKIEMAARRLSTLEPAEQTYSTRGED